MTVRHKRVSLIVFALVLFTITGIIMFRVHDPNAVCSCSTFSF